MGTLDVNKWARPTFTDFDNALLKQFMKAETELWRRRCHGITNDDGGNGANSGRNDFLSIDIAATLVRHGKVLQEIHSFFQKLIPRCYLMKLACQMEPDHFQVVPLDNRSTFAGTQTAPISYKESEKLLHPKEYDTYKCALLVAHYPVLVSSSSGIPNPTTSPPNPRSRQHTEASLTPASKECMLYDKDPISPTSVFSIDSDVLTELVRKAFCITQRRHTIYKNLMGKSLQGDPAKMLLQEMREQLTILINGWHPFFQPNPNIFYNKYDYHKWLEKETSEIKEIIEQQEQLVQTPVTKSLLTIPHHFKDKHEGYQSLLVKLFKLENCNSRKNIATEEAIPMKPLSAEPSRLLNEFGERYRIGELYRRISLLHYFARNFETKAWHCRHVTSVIESILQSVRSERCFVVKKEVNFQGPLAYVISECIKITMFKSAVVNLIAHIEHSLSRINRLFPKNSPEGGLQAVICLLSTLVMVDQDEVFGEQDGQSVTYHLKKYARDEMCTNYERQKIIIADQLKIRIFDQQSTPRMINLMILHISEKLRNYRMFFKKEFIEYFDIVEMAVKIFYGLLMEDVLELCETHEKHKNIDYPMIALAYRLSSFDKDPAWKNYLLLEKQTWRQPFLMHALSWMTSLRYKLQDFVTKASKQDCWKGIGTKESKTDSTLPKCSFQEQMATEAELNHPSPSITPSATSAFVQVRPSCNTARASPATRAEIDNENPDDRATESLENTNRSDTPDGHISKQLEGAACGQVPKTDDSGGLTTAVASCSKDHVVNCDGVSLLRDSPATVTRSRQGTFMSIESHASETPSEYTDARSCVCDLEYMISQAGNDVTDGTIVVGYADQGSIPVSSSLIDLVSAMNRLVCVVCHFAQLLCPNTTMTHDPLRLTPEGRSEVKDQLTAGRVQLMEELGDMLGSLAIFYGYQVLCAESCGVNDDALQDIIGKQCLDSLLNQLQLYSDVRLCRHNTAGVTRCNAADLQGKFVPPCSGIHRIHNSITQCEKLVKEMCVRVNNIRTIKNVLATLIETAFHNVLDPCSRSDVELDVMSVGEAPSFSTSQNGTSHSSDSIVSVQLNNFMDKNSIAKFTEELQEIEEGLVKLMAYRANAAIKKLLQLLLTLNLRTFTYHERLRPVLKATKRTIQILASSLYHDCYVSVLRNFWLSIVENFEDERANLVFLNGTAEAQAGLLLQAVSLFIELFRAEGDIIPLAFISKSIEPVLQSLDFYTLPTNSLIEMYEAVQMRNESVGRTTQDSDIRVLTRYQKPSEVLIGRLRIELHSESPYFSGGRFVECVVDQIRYEGNLKLGICVSPNSCDEDSAVILGQYLLDKDIICVFGKIVANMSEDSQEPNDDDLDEELERHSRLGSRVIIPERKSPYTTINQIPVFKECRACSPTIVQDSGGSSTFSDSHYVLYKFLSSDVEESFRVINDEYQVTTSGDTTQNDLIRVLFTRRNTEKVASNFLMNLGEDEVLQNLTKEYDLHHNSFTNCCMPSASPA